MASFGTLPVYIVYMILDNLWPEDILMSIYNVCHRLNSIIESYHPYQVISHCFLQYTISLLFHVSIISIEHRCVVLVPTLRQVFSRVLRFVEGSHQRKSLVDELDRLIFLMILNICNCVLVSFRHQACPIHIFSTGVFYIIFHAILFIHNEHLYYNSIFLSQTK